MYLYLDVKSNRVGVFMSVYEYLTFLRRILRLAACTCIWVVLYFVTEDVAVGRGVIVVSVL